MKIILSTIITLIVIVINMSLANGEDTGWEVKTEHNRLYLVNLTNSLQRFEIGSEGGTPNFLAEIACDKNDDIIIFKYRAGFAGTTRPVEFIRIAIVNKKTNLLIRDIEIEVNDFADSKKSEISTFVCEKDSVKIISGHQIEEIKF